MNRRIFLESAGAASLAVGQAQETEPGLMGSRKMVGIQIGAVSFVDEGVDKVLDIVQERARVNSIFLITYAYNRGLAGRQIPGHPFPDHGKQEPDHDFVGGYYATPHMDLYKATPYKAFRAPELGDFNILASVLPAMKKRGLSSFAFMADNLPEKPRPDVEKLQERNLDGAAINKVCFRNPNYQALLMAMVEDCLRTYDLDGLLWRSEATGPFGMVLGMTHGSPSRATCFCEFCRKAARERGVDVDRSLQGYRALEAFADRVRKGRKHVDGAFTDFWRIMLDYPEILAWNMLWVDGVRQTHRAVYSKAKSIKPKLMVGWAIAHNNAFNPFFRAENNLGVMTGYTDFLKVLTYHNAGGERTVRYVDNLRNSILADLTPSQALDFIYGIALHKQGTYDQIAKTGFTDDFVYREAKRSVEATAGSKTRIWPGIDVDLPTRAGNSRCTPEKTKAAVLAAFRGGAHGVLLARKYSEMWLANLSGAGQAVRELGLG